MNVLFVCEDNSALSIMAEAILSAVAPGRFGAFSAGCYPNGSLNGYAVEFLARHHMPVTRARAKSLEQLRALGNGIGIFVLETACTNESVSVDTPEDLERVRTILSERRK